MDEPSEGRHTALGEATLRGDVDTVKLCLEFGADPAKIDENTHFSTTYNFNKSAYFAL